MFIQLVDETRLETAPSLSTPSSPSPLLLMFLCDLSGREVLGVSGHPRFDYRSTTRGHVNLTDNFIILYM